MESYASKPTVRQLHGAARVGTSTKQKRTRDPTAEMTRTSPLRIAFISSNQEWGGSEHLWSAAAAMLAADGHSVLAYKNLFEPNLRQVATLSANGAKLIELADILLVPRKLLHPLLNLLGRPLVFA